MERIYFAAVQLPKPINVLKTFKTVFIAVGELRQLKM
jgi:hypothetical protein